MVKKCDAKQQLIDLLVSDKQGQFARPEEIEDVLRNGFQGFGNMTAAELSQAAADAGLLGRNAEAAKLVAALSA